MPWELNLFGGNLIQNRLKGRLVRIRISGLYTSSWKKNPPECFAAMKIMTFELVSARLSSSCLTISCMGSDKMF